MEQLRFPFSISISLFSFSLFFFFFFFSCSYINQIRLSTIFYISNFNNNSTSTNPRALQKLYKIARQNFDVRVQFLYGNFFVILQEIPVCFAEKRGNKKAVNPVASVNKKQTGKPVYDL